MLGIAGGTAFLVAVALGPLGVAAAVLGPAFAILVSRGRRGLWRSVAAVLVIAVLGAWRGHDHYLTVASDPALPPAPPWTDAVEAVRGTVTVAPRVDSRRQGVDLALEAVRLGPATDADGRWTPVAGQVCASLPASLAVALGDRLFVVGQATALADLPRNVREALRGRGCEATLFATWATVDAPGDGVRRLAGIAQQRLTTALRRAAPGDGGALLAGLATGMTTPSRTNGRPLPANRDDPHHGGQRRQRGPGRGCGVSRGHRWRLASPLRWQLPTVAAVWGYALLTGLGAPVVRAALVASAVVLALRLGRRPDLLTLTVLAGAVMVAVDPAQLTRLSFQLSFASSLALVAVLAGTTPTGIRGWAESVVKASAAAQLATLPITLATFGTVSLTSVPTNLLIGPLVAVAFPLAVLTAPLAWLVPALGAAAAVPAVVAASTIFAVVDRLGAVDRGLVMLGRSSLAGTIVLTVVVVFAVGAMSEEARRFWNRAVRSPRGRCCDGVGAREAS
jgi:ComEC/Rec2-related protein